MSFLSRGDSGDYLFLLFYLLIDGVSIVMALMGTFRCPRELSTTVFGSSCNTMANWRRVPFQYLVVFVVGLVVFLVYKQWYISLIVVAIFSVVTFIQSFIYNFKIAEFKEKERIRKEERYREWLKESGQE